MSVHETMLGHAWIYSVLSGDSTLASYAPGGIFRGMAPKLVSTPFVIQSFQGGTDTTTQNGYRILDELLYQIKAVGPATQTTSIVQAASQIDALLARTSGTTTGGNIYSCYRQSPLQLDELVDGVLWTNIGGLYRVLIQQTN